MKKIVAVLLTVLMLFSLTACSSKDEAAEPITGDFVKGTINGDVYTNTFTKTTFTKPSSWFFATEQELIDKAGIGEYGYGIEDALESGIAIYDLQVKGDGGKTLEIGFDNLVMNGAEDITEEEYLGKFASQLESGGFTVEDLGRIKLGKNEYCAFECLINDVGIKVYQRYYVLRADKYMSFVIATSLEENFSDIEDMFS